MDKHLFHEVFSSGKTISGEHLYVKTLLIDGESKFSFSVPKSVVKKAAARNSLKRKGYSCLEEIIKEPPKGVVVIFFFKKGAQHLTKKELCSEIRTLLTKINK